MVKFFSLFSVKKVKKLNFSKVQDFTLKRVKIPKVQFLAGDHFGHLELRQVIILLEKRPLLNVRSDFSFSEKFRKILDMSANFRTKNAIVFFVRK